MRREAGIALWIVVVVAAAILGIWGLVDGRFLYGAFWLLTAVMFAIGLVLSVRRPRASR